MTHIVCDAWKEQEDATQTYTSSRTRLHQRRVYLLEHIQFPQSLLEVHHSEERRERKKKEEKKGNRSVSQSMETDQHLVMTIPVSTDGS